uniref:Phytocyanin domain-containing protein n=1 Tax=Fagus sylvatica TaxID=28930 RepID=A0A2N9IX42_FAGSY
MLLLGAFLPQLTFTRPGLNKYNFTVGDTLVFNFVTGQHDVATDHLLLHSVPLGSNTSSAPSQTHCSSGQKLAINVLASSSSPTPPGVLSPPPPPGAVSPPPPPPPSSSASSLAATFPLVLITIALTSFIKF